MADRSASRLTADESAELQRAVGGHLGVLGLARGQDVLVVLGRDRMAVRRPKGWHLVAWSDIRRGGWDSERRRLYWELVEGTLDEVALDAPGQLPHAFAERVQASIAVSRHVMLTDDLGTVLIMGRRRPGSNDPIIWQVEGVGHCDLNDPRVQSQVMDQVEELRGEFE